MNTQVKLLNDALVSTARMLDELFTQASLEGMDIETDEIEMSLIEASEALASIKIEDSNGNTWTYQGSDSLCEGDDCRLEI